jgi:hypothetical protein
MKRLVPVFVAVVLVFATAGTAAADNMRLSGSVDLVPMGEFANEQASVDAAFAYGGTLSFAYDVHPNFAVGIAPRYVLGLKAKDVEGDAATQLDIPLRLIGGAPLADGKARVYGYAAPGYSIVMPPEGDSWKGFMLGFGAGGMYAVTPKLMILAEVGYTLGFQKVEDVEAATNLLTASIGVSVPL